MLNEKLQRAVEPCMSILVGTVDAAGNPSCCRGVALTSKDGVDSVTLYVPVATSQEVLANVATTRRVAIVASHPIDHCSMQLKGLTKNVRLARPDEAPMVRERVEAWSATLQQIGVAPAMTLALNHWPAFAIDVDVLDVFDQTPGPKAGTPLE